MTPTNGTTVISAPHVRLSPTALKALNEQAARGRQLWSATTNPQGWATSPGTYTRRTMGTLVTAGLLERKLRNPMGVYLYCLTEAGRKVAS